MYLFASNLLTLIFSYTACCSNFYLQFFVLFWNVQIKFRSLHFHWIQIFCGQVTYLYCSVDFIGFIGFIEGGRYIIYIITIVRNIVKLLCQNMHWKILNFKRKMNCMTAIDLKALRQLFDILLDYFVKKIKFMKKKSILCQWHIKMSITSK